MCVCKNNSIIKGSLDQLNIKTQLRYKKSSLWSDIAYIMTFLEQICFEFRFKQWESWIVLYRAGKRKVFFLHVPQAHNQICDFWPGPFVARPTFSRGRFYTRFFPRRDNWAHETENWAWKPQIWACSVWKWACSVKNGPVKSQNGPAR